MSAYLDGNGSEREIVKCNRKIDDVAYGCASALVFVRCHLIVVIISV